MAQVTIAGRIAKEVVKVGESFIITIAEQTGKDKVSFFDVFTSQEKMVKHLFVGMQVTAHCNQHTYMKKVEGQNRKQIAIWAHRVVFLNNAEDRAKADEKAKAKVKEAEEEMTPEELEEEEEDRIAQERLDKRKAARAKAK